MKATFWNATGSAQCVRVAFAAFVLASSAAFGQAQPKSPVGTTWDCVLSGPRTGIAYLTFYNDGTLVGEEVLVPKTPASPVQGLVSIASIGNGLGPRPGPAPTNRTDLCGSFPLHGTWGFGNRGQVVGSFLEVAYRTDNCSPTTVPVSTNYFDSPSPVFERYEFPLTYSVTEPISTNKAAGLFKNQTVTYIDQVSVSTNFFDAPLPIAKTNVVAQGLSVTLPASTNLVAVGYTEATICYAANVKLGTNTFESLTSISATNTFLDGTFHIIRPIETNTLGNYIEEITYYAAAGPISTNRFETTNLISKVEATSDATFCMTAPVSTNMVADTYKNMTVSYLLTEDCKGWFTNTVSFSATVLPGKRLTMLGKSALGSVTYRGVPAVALPNMSGSWRSVKHQNQIPSYEFFELTDSLYAPNTYTVSGSGPDYSYSGLALLSSRKKIAFACEVMAGTHYQSTRAVMGSFNSRKATASVAGVEAPSGAVFATNRLTLQISRRTSLP